MNRAIPVTEGIYWTGVNDRRTELFEGMWPLPRGIAYNSYLIVDEKTALVDTVKAPFALDYLDGIRSVLKEGRGVDYLVINHMEPDHSGAVRVLREVFPNMQIVGNKRTVEFLEGFYGITGNTKTVADGESLDLGKRSLSFHLTPMVHWPETMMTYEKASGMLFSGDAFGSFGTLDGGIFDDELDMGSYADETLRYFSNIIGKYAAMVLKAIEKVKPLGIKIVGSTHGPVLRGDPFRVVNDYARWSRHDTEAGVVVAFASMYGNTEKMAEHVARAAAENGAGKVVVHDLSKTHVSYVIRDMWRFKGLVLGSCTYNLRLFPLMEHLVWFLEEMGIKNHALGIFGGYSWSGGAVKRLREFAEKGPWKFVEPVIEAKCAPSAGDLDGCMLLGKNMAQAARE